MKYDLVFIGFNPASLFSLIHLMSNRYRGKMLIIEKNKDMHHIDVDNNEYSWLNNFILKHNHIVGELAQKIHPVDYEYYSNITVKYINEFLENKKNWECFNSKSFNNILNDSKFINIRYSELLNILKQNLDAFKPYIEFKFETLIDKIDINENKEYVLKFNNQEIISSKIVLSVKHHNQLLKNLPSEINFQLENNYCGGILIEIDSNKDTWLNILEYNDEFSLSKKYSVFNETKQETEINRLYVSTDITDSSFKPLNYKPAKDKAYFSVLGDMGIEFTEEELNAFYKNISSKFQNKEPIIDLFKIQDSLFPKNMTECMVEFIQNLNELVDISNEYYWCPIIQNHIKILNSKIDGNIYDNFYIIGDAEFDGALSSTIQGLILADSLLGKLNLKHIDK